MALFNSISFLKNCFGDLCSLHLAIIGIGFTIFTLLYSFIYGKRSELISLSDRLKHKGASPLVAQKFESCRQYIIRFSKINFKCGLVILASSFLWVFSWLGYRVLSTSWIIYTNFIVVFVLTFAECAFCFHFLFMLIKQYRKDINV